MQGKYLNKNLLNITHFGFGVYSETGKKSITEI